MKKPITAAALVAALSIAATAAMAGTLTNVSVTLSDSRVSQPTDVTIRYTTATDLDTPSQNTNLLMAEFGGLTFTNGDCAGDATVKIDGVALLPGQLDICSFWGGKSVQFRIAPGEIVPAGSNVEITIDKARVTTTATAGSYATIGLRTTRDNDNPVVDTPVTQPTYFIGTPPPAPVPTLTEWAMILLTAALGGFAALTIHKRRRTV